MAAIIKDNKFVITTEPKTIYLDLSKDVNKNLKHETEYIIRHNEFLAFFFFLIFFLFFI